MSETKLDFSQEKGESEKVKRPDPNDIQLTQHAKERMNTRKIPQAMIEDAIANGKRIILPDRNAYQYELKNVLGIRGKKLIVIQGFNGCILTSYIERSVNKIRKS